MREIKFRAWNKNDGKMIYAAEAKNSKNLLAVGFHGLPIAIDRDSFRDWEIIGWNIDHYITLMQFTGLKDKNGREIYEGDIVRTHNDGQFGTFQGIVEFSTSQYQYKIIQAEEEQYDPSLGHISIKNIEVIGNVYENPELMGRER